MTVRNEVKQIIIDNFKVAGMIIFLLSAYSVVGYLENSSSAKLSNANKCNSSTYVYDNPNKCNGDFKNEEK